MTHVLILFHCLRMSVSLCFSSSLSSSFSLYTHTSICTIRIPRIAYTSTMCDNPIYRCEWFWITQSVCDRTFSLSENWLMQTDSNSAILEVDSLSPFDSKPLPRASAHSKLNYKCVLGHIDGLMHLRRNSIANGLELHLSCTNLSIWCRGGGFMYPTDTLNGHVAAFHIANISSTGFR